MRIWFDTEFIEDGRTIELLSIGMVREDGRHFYAEADWTDHEKASPWVKENVLPHLLGPSCQLSRRDMQVQIIDFAGDAPEFWADYGAYDWVVLCQLYGPMVALPEVWPMWCRDFRMIHEEKGRPKLPADTSAGPAHNALSDAMGLARHHAWLEGRVAPC